MPGLVLLKVAFWKALEGWKKRSKKEQGAKRMGRAVETKSQRIKDGS